MKKILKSVFMLAVSVLVLVSVQSCGVTPVDQAKLDGYWVLTEINGTKAEEVFKGAIPSLEFNRTDSMIAGNAGCNRYFGQYKIDEQNQFLAPTIGSTQKLCLEDNQEAEFLKALGASAVLGFNEAGNLIFTKDNVVVLSFVKGEAPVAAAAATPVTVESLTGAWTLKSMGSEDVKVLFAEKLPTIEFDAEGMAFGNSGCNNYRTKTTLEGEVLSFGPLMGTKMACPHLEGEGKYTELLNGQLTASISEDVLTLSKDGQAVLEFIKNK